MQKIPVFNLCIKKVLCVLFTVNGEKESGRIKNIEKPHPTATEGAWDH